MQIKQITEAMYCLDGGSIMLESIDVEGQSHSIFLVQHGIPDNTSEDELFGRLYVDRNLVPIRSEQERKILADLKQVRIVIDSEEDDPECQSGTRLVLGDDIRDYFDAVDQGPEAATAKLIADLIEWVESPEYTALPKAR